MIGTTNEERPFREALGNVLRQIANGSHAISNSHLFKKFLVVVNMSGPALPPCHGRYFSQSFSSCPALQLKSVLGIVSSNLIL